MTEEGGVKMSIALKKRKSIDPKYAVLHTLLILLMLLFVVIALFPFVWMLSSSFKEEKEMFVFRSSGFPRYSIRKTIPRPGTW